jgi:hypothetical protein
MHLCLVSHVFHISLVPTLDPNNASSCFLPGSHYLVSSAHISRAPARLSNSGSSRFSGAFIPVAVMSLRGARRAAFTVSTKRDRLFLVKIFFYRPNYLNSGTWVGA